ncbi:MAG: glycosyltransferase family 4 protein [Gemmatimonadales bacterium]|nr:glycosyltransferase family 4 protein [Gemmatimonadales bacterium]
MLRAIDDVDGQGIYIRKLCDALFEAGVHNEYVAFYSNAGQSGRYRGRANVREVVLPGGAKLVGDQVLVPLAARRESLDVLFHHKFGTPPVTDPATLARVRERYQLPAPPYLLMVVRGHQIQEQTALKALTPRKNVEVALEAYGRMRTRSAGERKLPPALVILGIGIADRLTPDVVGAFTGSDAVHTPGFVEFTDMPALYSMARALVFPSRYESFGIPIVEAMACGCPVVTSATSACPEVAGNAGLLVEPDDVDALGSAMERVSFDDRLVHDLRGRGLRRAATFSWSDSARTLLAELLVAARAR